MATESEINVKVTATVDDFARGMKSAADSTGVFTEEINKAAAEAHKIDPEAFKGLAESLNAGTIGVKEFSAGLAGINGVAAEATAATKAVGEASHLTAAGMRELVVVAREIATGNVSRLPGSLSILATRLDLLSPAGILAAAGIAAVGYAIYEAIESSEKFEAELTTIQNSLTAVGAGNSFDRTAITAYIDTLRQIPGVDRDAAESMVNEFSRARNVVQSGITGELVPSLQRFAQLIGEDVPKAAKDMAAAFNDPVKGLQTLQRAGIELSAAQQEEIRQMMAVNDVAGAQKVLFAGLSQAMQNIADNTTPMEQFWSTLGADIDGVNIKARHAQEALLATAAAAEKFGDLDRAKDLRQQAEYAGSDARNLPDASAVRAANARTEESRQAQAEQEKQQDQVRSLNNLFERGNSLLAEQEKHKQNLTVIQQGINAAEAQHDDAAVKRGYAALETENKRYYGEPKAQKTPKAPREDDSVDRMLVEEQKINQATIEGDAGVAQEKIKTAQNFAREQRELGQTSSEEELAALSGLAEAEHTIELTKFDQLADLYKNDLVEYTRIQSQKQEADQRYQQQLDALRTRAAKSEQSDLQKQQQQYTQTAQGILRPWENAFTGIANGSRTFQQAATNAARTAETQIASFAVQALGRYLATEAAKTAANLAGNKSRVAADSAGQDESLLSHIESAGKHILTDAGEVFGNVYAYLSPDIGPFAAIPAAASAAAVLAVELPSAAGGWVVPGDTMAMVHENEMILPAHLSQGIAGMIAGGGSNNGGGHTFNSTYNISGVQPREIPGMIDAHIQKQVRNGAYGGMRTAR